MKFGQIYNVPEGMSYDDYSIDILYDVIETKSRYNNVYVKVHNDKYVNPDLDEKLVEKFTGGIINTNGKYGYVDENLNITIPTIYNGIYDLTINNEFLKTETGEKFHPDYSNYVRIYNDSGNGIANKQGEILIDCQYKNIIYYGDNTFAVTKTVNNSSKIGVVDINNNIVIDFIDGYFDAFKGYFISTPYTTYNTLYNGNHCEGVIDRNFNIVLEPIYSDITIRNFDKFNYHEYYFVVEKDKKRAVLGVNGTIKIDYCDLSVYQLLNQYENMIIENLLK